MSFGMLQMTKRKGLEELAAKRKHIRFSEDGEVISNNAIQVSHDDPPPSYLFPISGKPIGDKTGSLISSRKYWPRNLTWQFLRELLRCSSNSLEDTHKPKFTPALLPPWEGASIDPLPEGFTSVEDYQRAWATLLLVETLESVRNYRSDGIEERRLSWFNRIDSQRDKVFGMVQSLRYSVGDGGRGELRVVRVLVQGNQELFDGDLVLLSCPAWTQTTLGVVLGWDPDVSLWTLEEERGSRYVDLIVCEGSDVRAKGWLPVGSIRKGDELHMYFLANIITSIRECRGIDAVASVPAMAVVVNPTPGPAFSAEAAEDPQRPKLMPERMWDAFQREFNAKQVQAIECTCRASYSKPAQEDMPFVLVQGPPGTGKTKTITGIIAAVLEGCGRHPALGPPPIIPGKCFGIPIERRFFGVGPNKQRPYRTLSKILVCSPSNTAIDELICRIKYQGIIGHDGQCRRGEDVYVVRLGRRKGSESAASNSAVDNCSLENLVETQKKSFTSFYGDSMNALRRCIIEEADVVCCTLSSVDSKGMIETLMGLDTFAFDCLIIDEATQAVESSTLIPLKLQPRVVVLIGDPCQLRPTVLMQNRRLREGYSQSLFERLMGNGFPVISLQEQYRMHPVICLYPSRRFYGNSLVNAPSMVKRSPPVNFYAHPSGKFKPFVLHSVAGEESFKGNSLVNKAEVTYAIALYKTFLKEYGNAKSLELGVICPYSAMRQELHQAFSSSFGSLSPITVSTIDGFQGKEKDVVIFCCVRARSTGNCKEKGIGFLSDRNRINVALTRAKYALWILGDFEHLQKNDREWEALVSHARETNCFIE